MTTQHFYEVIVDKGQPDRKVTLECGHVGGSGEELMYLEIDGKMFILDPATGRKLCTAVDDIATRLRYT